MRLRTIEILDILAEATFYIILVIPMLFLGGVLPWSGLLIHIFATLLLVIYFSKSFLLGRIIFFGKMFNILAGLLFISLALSTIFSVYRHGSISNLILFLDALIVFIVSVSEKKNRNYFERVVFVLVLVGILHAVYAIYKPLFMPALGKGSWYLNGTFYNNNHFAAYIELIFFLPVLMLYFRKDLIPAKKYILWIAVVSYSLALLMSLSRGAVVSVLFTFVLISLVKFPGRKKVLTAVSLFFYPF